MTDIEFQTQLDKTKKSLSELFQSIEGFPNPSNYIKEEGMEQIEGAVAKLGTLKKELDDLENKILHPFNRAQRRASEKKIQKMANNFERKSQERVTSRNVSEK